jgi:hypothetical protein
MSAMAGPAFGLTSSMTESWVASAPAAVNHCSGSGGAQSVAASGEDCERPATSPGASSSAPLMTAGPGSCGTVLTRSLRTGNGVVDGPNPTWSSPDTFVAGSAPSVVAPIRSP